MDAAIAEYVSAVREVCAGGLSLCTKVRRIEALAKELIAKPLALDRELRYVPPSGYGRNLIHRDEEHGFVVIAMVWPPHTIGSPHDHSTWGVVAVSEGSVRISNYEREDDGRDPASAKLREVFRLDGRPGDVGHVLPPHEDIHAISNVSAEPAVSIHTYGRDIKRCRVFDCESGKVDQVDLAYHKSVIGV